MRKGIHILSLLLILVLLFSGCGKTAESGGNNADSMETPDKFAYTVLVTINPEIKLYMDESDKILAVEYLNNDAKTAYSDKEIVGLTLDDGLANIVETAIEKEYLKDGKDITVELDEVKSDTVNRDTVLSSADRAIKAVLKEKDIAANVIITTDSETAASITDTSSTTQLETTQPVTNTSASNTEPIVIKCANCGGSGECPGCHGGKDQCPACDGTGNEVCQNCDTNGMQTCPNCHGSGKDSGCPVCRGSGQDYCGRCGGSGVDQGQVCVDCGGTGKVKCEQCNGTGQDVCHHCNGSGKTKCEICNGKHTWVCTHCKGSGTDKDCPECNGSFKCSACGGTGIQQ